MPKPFYVYTVIKTTTVKETFEVSAQAGDEAAQAIEYDTRQGNLIDTQEKISYTRGKRRRWCAE